MKKSEMVGVIKKVLQESELSTWGNFGKSSFVDVLINKDANRIMEEIEKAGMLPPLRLYTHKEDFWNKAVCAEMDGIEIKVSMWENEEEEK